MTEEPGQVQLPFEGLRSFLEQEPAHQKVSSITNFILALVNVIGDSYAIRCSICGIDIDAYYGRRNYSWDVVSAKVGVAKPPRAFAAQYIPTFLLYKVGNYDIGFIETDVSAGYSSLIKVTHKNHCVSLSR